MLKDFGNDLTSSSFIGDIASEIIRGPSVWLGEMSILGIVPPTDSEVVGEDRPYSY